MLQNWAIPGLFFFIFVFSIQLIVHIYFADDWIRTADLWCQKQPLYQLRLNHFPKKEVLQSTVTEMETSHDLAQ